MELCDKFYCTFFPSVEEPSFFFLLSFLVSLNFTCQLRAWFIFPIKVIFVGLVRSNLSASPLMRPLILSTGGCRKDGNTVY